MCELVFVQVLAYLSLEQLLECMLVSKYIQLVIKRMLRREFKELCSYGTGTAIFAGIRDNVAQYFYEQRKLSDRYHIAMKLRDNTKRVLTIYARLYPVKIDTRDIKNIHIYAFNEIIKELIIQHYRFLSESTINTIVLSSKFLPGIVIDALAQGFDPNKLLPYPCDLPLIYPYMYQPNITLITWAYITKKSYIMDLILDYFPDFDKRAENGISMRIAVAYKWGHMSPKLHNHIKMHTNITV